MTQPKLWSDRDFDECCYPVSGEGRFTMVCAVVGRGSYCEAHRREMAEEYDLKPRLIQKISEAKRQPPAPEPAVAGPSFRGMTLSWLASRVARKYGVTVDEIKGRGRSPRVNLPRQEFFYLAHHAGRSYPAAGRFCGDRDHTTAIWAKKRHEARVEAFEATRLRWDEAA